MPRLDYISDEDLKGQKIYDAKLVKRLLRYAKPYIWLMVLAFFVLIASSAINVYLPTLDRKAIDEYIVLNYQLFDFSAHDTLTKRYIDKYGAAMFVVGRDSFVIDGNLIDPADMKLAQRLKVVVPMKFMTIDTLKIPPQLRDTAISIIKSYGSLFLRVLGRGGEKFTAPPKKSIFMRQTPRKPRLPQYIISYKNLSKIPPAEIKLIRAQHISGIVRIAILYFVLLIGLLVLNFVQIFTLNLVAQKSMHGIRVDLFSHIQKLSLKFFDSNPIGKIVTRLTNDINALSEMFTSVAVALIRDIIVLIGVGIILYMMNRNLSLIVFALLPVVTLIMAILRGKLRDAFRWMRRELAALNARLSEDFGGVRIIQAFTQERRAIERFDEVNKRYFKATMRVLFVNALFYPVVGLFRNMGLALLLWYGGGQVIRQAMSLGMLVAYMYYIEMFFRPLVGISDKFAIMQSAMAAAERIFKLMDTKPEIKVVRKVYKPKPSQVRGKVEFRDVWFAYDKDWVLRGISFVAQPGEVVGIVGETGAGKTTITALVSRLYDVNKGQILIDDVDIRDWDLKTLRSVVGVVLQDVFLFSTDVRENIRLFEKRIGDDDLMRVIKIVNADEFIKKLPGGLDEPVAERGATFSAGERQLLSFARALVFEPKILILDEATANIDTHTEKLIQEAIDRLLKGRTSLVVAHRLSTIRKANKILVVHNGRIIESGKHEELLAKGGFYAHLYRIQFRQNG